MTVICSIYFPASSYLVFFVYTFVENNHDCLGVMQFLYYKGLSKHVLKSEDRDRARV